MALDSSLSRKPQSRDFLPQYENQWAGIMNTIDHGNMLLKIIQVINSSHPSHTMRRHHMIKQKVFWCLKHLHIFPFFNVSSFFLFQDR